ncbi:MAG: flagellar basal body rod protein FlgC [Roseomonas sp.]|jgi:flagellar basal-body rod protein FlgC
MDLDRALRIAASGMDMQTRRLRIVAENLANRDTTAETPGGDPYRRKTVTFTNRFDRELGANAPKVRRVGTDPREFNSRFDPSHPAADNRGYVKTPNVNSTIEVMDMREAQRSYSANLSVLEVTRGMLTRTIEAMR